MKTNTKKRQSAKKKTTKKPFLLYRLTDDIKKGKLKEEGLFLNWNDKITKINCP